MKDFEKLKELTLIEIVAKGCEYAVDKNGFTCFAIENWNKNKEDLVRALVCVAKILKEDGNKRNHELHVLDFVFNSANKKSDNLVVPLMQYFDDKEFTLTKKFLKAVNNYNEARELHSQLQFLEYSTLEPLIKSVDICKLMSYDQKEVFVSVSDKENNIKSGVFKVRFYGNNVRNMKVKMGGNVVPLVGIDHGVVAMLDSNSLETIYQNHYLASKRYTSLQKTGFIYGIDDAKEFYAKRLREMENEEIEDPIINL